jgi:CRP/FNR family transcriptional regulator, cyclic AMP receptor protein
MTPPPAGTSALLARATLFEALPAEIIEEAAASMHEVRLDGGQLLFSRGDIGDAIYLVLDGRVRLSIQTWEGRELSFRHAVEGQIFGEIAVLDASPRTADAIALVPTRLLSLPAAAFERLVARYPSLARSTIRFLCARLRDVSGQIEDIALRPIEVRLARFVLGRLPRKASEGEEQRTERIDLGISQSELALLIGASRPKVNGALTVLEQSGAIARKGRWLVCDRKTLWEIAQRD